MTVAELQLGFNKIMNKNHEDFIGFPDNYADAAENWADIFEEYYMSQVTPIPGSANTLLEAGLETFKAALLVQMIALEVKLEPLITALHTQVIAGVTAAGLHATIPPPEPLDLSSCFLSGPNYEGTVTSVINALSSTIDKWVKTSKSTLILPPNTVIPWA